MSDVRSGGAFWELYLKDEKFRRGVKDSEKIMKSLARTSLQVGGTLGTLGATGAAAFAPAIKAASDLEEVVNAFNATFKENSNAVREWGKAFGQEVGRSERQMLDFLQGSQSLLVPIGFEQDEAEEMSKQLTKLAVDVASFKNEADEDVMAAFKSALIGSHETVARYGAIINEVTLKQELMNMGLDPKNITQAQKVQARFNIILRATVDAQGDAIRSGGSFANQMKALTADLEDTGAAVGKAVLPALTDLVGMASDAATTIGDFAEEHPAAIKLAGQLTVTATGAGGALVALGLALNTASNAMAIYSAVSKASQAGTLSFGASLTQAGTAARLLGAAVATIGIATMAYKGSSAMRELNAALEESVRLSAKMAEMTNQGHSDTLSEAARQATPAEEANYLREALAKANLELDGQEDHVDSAVKARERAQAKHQGAKAAAGYASLIAGPVGYLAKDTIKDQFGKAEIDEAVRNEEATKARRDAQRDFVHTLEERLKDVEAAQRRTAAIMSDPTGTSGVPPTTIPAPAPLPPITVPKLSQHQGIGVSPEMARLLDESRFGHQISGGGGSGGGGPSRDRTNQELLDRIDQLLAVNKDMRRELRKSPVIVGDRP